MLQSPKKRICPSLIFRICSNVLRQPPGEMKGSAPSSTSMKASASQTTLPSTMKDYFLPAAGAVPKPEPRMALKKSDEGSSTITSLFLLKLAL